MEIYRQGDILIVSIDSLPEQDMKPVAREAGRIILARGETTGHAHAIATRGVKLLEVSATRYLVANKPFVIAHEEHAPVKVPAGTFRVIQQREYTPSEIRSVRD